jgi:hypothetical protein
MLAANNLTEVFDFLFPLVAKKISNATLFELLNRQNSTGNTPLRKEAAIQTTPRSPIARRWW